MKFPELTYATPTDPPFKRWVIQTLETWSGRDYFVPLYETWRRDFVGRPPQPIIGPALDLLEVNLDIVSGRLPDLKPDAPLIIVSNHPFGILDGLGALALAESLGRPFKVLIHRDLVRVPEIEPYALPVDFAETREAQAANIQTRKKALELLAQGTTIVVFPAGGVATSPTIFGRAVDLPWKTFTARMILSSRAQVLPLYFEGQCSTLFQAASKVSLTLRLSVIIREFRRKVGQPLKVHVGDLIPFEDIPPGNDRKALMQLLHERVHAMSDMSIAQIRERQARLPAYLRG
ncbi:MAG: lysophospholipid acyltransferase family protein [Hyphomicrobiaceae bacterium]|nr:lysophospholipid acyltransferase family protein [Hyphomicrobiaceae bacterium]